MSTEPQFEMTDDAGIVHTVRITKNYIEGFGGENFRAAVADVSDVATGEKFMGVPLAKLIPCEQAS